MFPKSSITLLNKHTCNSSIARCTVEWYLVVDEYKFHVYVTAAIPEKELYVRIDWHGNSTLSFEPYDDKPGEQRVHIGNSHTFCRHCIIDTMKNKMHYYRPFGFNCRTVAYLILTKVELFDATLVFDKFNEMDILCGLDPRECVSLEEIHHYINHVEGTGEWCNII